MRMYLDPPQTKQIAIQDRSDRFLTPQEITDLANRRVKWARRNGRRVAVMLEAQVKGREGTLLFFPEPSDYDSSIRRVFR